jgi:hypothetical protein
MLTARDRDIPALGAIIREPAELVEASASST